MILTGYHGTSKENAKNILGSKTFDFSVGKTEWLGHGIYFYYEYRDAVEWTKKKGMKPPAILLGIVRVRKNDILDFDSKKGKKVLQEFKKLFLKYNVASKSAQQNQCEVMQFLWARRTHYKVFIGSFPKEKSDFPFLIDTRDKRREFCVKDGHAIVSIIELEVFKR